jgi:hypothetical protein
MTSNDSSHHRSFVLVNEEGSHETVRCYENIQLMSQIIDSLSAAIAAPSLCVSYDEHLAFEELVKVVNASTLPSLKVKNPCVSEKYEPNFLRKIYTEWGYLRLPRDWDKFLNTGLLIQKVCVWPTRECWDTMTSVSSKINVHELKFLLSSFSVFESDNYCRFILDGLYHFLLSEAGSNISRITFDDGSEEDHLFDQVPVALFLPLFSVLSAFLNMIRSLGEDCYLRRFTIARTSTQSSTTSIDWANWAIVHVTLEELEISPRNVTALAEAFPFLEKLEVESEVDISAPGVRENEVGLC